MTKKDYKLIAGTIKRRLDNAHRLYVHNETERKAYINGIKGVVEELARKLKADNPRFDKAKFIVACGTNL